MKLSPFRLEVQAHEHGFLNTTSMDDLIKLEEVSVHYTENGDFEVTADGGVLGKVKVKVNVPGGGDAKLEESGSFKITENIAICPRLRERSFPTLTSRLTYSYLSLRRRK